MGQIRFMAWIMIAGLVVLTACGGGNSATSTPPATTTTTTSPATPGTAQVSVTMGDAPADRVVSFEITITSLVLTDNSGKSVTVLSPSDPPRRIELTHLSADAEPFAFAKVPAGTYTGAQVGWANPEVTFLNGTAPGPVVPVEKEFNTSGTANVTFSPNLVINATSVLNLDLNLANAVTIDFTTNPPTVTVNPSAAFSLASANQVAEANEDENEKGELEDIVGTITAVSSNSLTITTTTGAAMTFSIDSTTKIEAEDASALAPNMIVKVEGITRADGTMLAKEIESEANDDRNGLEAEGLVSSIASSGTSFTIIDHDDMGSSMAGMAGKPLTVNTNTNTKFVIDNKNNRVNLSGLTFAQFNSVSLGQQVEADADTPMATGTVSARKVKLEQQALRGTVSNLASDGSSFTLTPAADSAFSLITGKTSLTVFKSSAVVKPGASVANGSTVRVRGLLFLDGATYKLVASRITP